LAGNAQQHRKRGPITAKKVKKTMGQKSKLRATSAGWRRASNRENRAGEVGRTVDSAISEAQANNRGNSKRYDETNIANSQ
jgi:hypothetical protein